MMPPRHIAIDTLALPRCRAPYAARLPLMPLRYAMPRLRRHVEIIYFRCAFIACFTLLISP